LVQSQRCAALDASDPETQLLVETARLLQASGLAVLMVDMPHDGGPTKGCRAESIWARQQRILRLFEEAHARYPDTPIAVLAVGEGAQSVEALLRRPRPETSHVKTVLLADVPKRDGYARPLCVVSDCMDFRAQIEAAAVTMWREVLAESYSARILRGLSEKAQDGCSAAVS
jgi:hypothetical protein